MNEKQAREIKKAVAKTQNNPYALIYSMRFSAAALRREPLAPVAGELVARMRRIRDAVIAGREKS